MCFNFSKYRTKWVLSLLKDTDHLSGTRQGWAWQKGKPETSDKAGVRALAPSAARAKVWTLGLSLNEIRVLRDIALGLWAFVYEDNETESVGHYRHHSTAYTQAGDAKNNGGLPSWSSQPLTGLDTPAPGAAALLVFLRPPPSLVSTQQPDWSL